MGVIFDLDQTLVNTELAFHTRKRGDWKTTYSLIPQFTVYKGIKQLIKKLEENNIPVCIVTSSPSRYCEMVTNHHGITIENKVCYHDTKRRKPNPDPILRAIEMLNVDPSTIVSIGDDVRDIIASKAAGVYSVGIMWGGGDIETLRNANPDSICETVSDLEILLKEKFNLD